MHLALLASALLAGSLLAVQAAANVQLNKAVGTPYGAATLQLGVAAALLLALAVAAGAIDAVRLVADLPAWQLLGGLASPLYITSGILLFPRLGALAAVGLFVTGQLVASVVIDVFGLLGVPAKPPTAGMVLGVIAALAGITAVIRGQSGGPRRVPAGGPVLGGALPGGGGRVATATPPRAGARARSAGWLALGIVAGAGLPVQGAVNAQLREGLREPLAVALTSFIVATAAISVVLLGMAALRATALPQVRPLASMPWWGWLGAACAASYVTATFMLLPVIGAATTVTLTVTGQQVASAVIDRGGLFRLPRRDLTPHRVLGLVLLVAGSALVQLA